MKQATDLCTLNTVKYKLQNAGRNQCQNLGPGWAVKHRCELAKTRVSYQFLPMLRNRTREGWAGPEPEPEAMGWAVSWCQKNRVCVQAPSPLYMPYKSLWTSHLTSLSFHTLQYRKTPTLPYLTSHCGNQIMNVKLVYNIKARCKGFIRSISHLNFSKWPFYRTEWQWKIPVEDS